MVHSYGGEQASATGVPCRSAIVVGAGVVGVASAYALARRGVTVTLIDSQHEAGRGTSFANGAQLSYVYTDALASPSLLRHAPGLLLGVDPAFRLRMNFDSGYFYWLLRFLRNTSAGRFRANTLEALLLGLESRAAMHRLLESHMLDFGHASNGKLHIYDNVDIFAATANIVAMKRSAGAIQDRLTPAEALSIEPALRARREPFAGAVYSPQEEVGDPYRFCNGLLQVLRTQYSVSVRLGTEVREVRDSAACASVVTTTGEHIAADVLVICAGIEARRFLGRLGMKGTLVPMKGYSFNAPQERRMPASMGRNSPAWSARHARFCRRRQTIHGPATAGRASGQ